MNSQTNCVSTDVSLQKRWCCDGGASGCASLVGAGRTAVFMRPELVGLGPRGFPACRLVARLAIRWRGGVERARILGTVVHGLVQAHGCSSIWRDALCVAPM